MLRDERQQQTISLLQARQLIQQNQYLAVIVSYELKWGDHIVKTIKNTNSAIGSLWRYLRHCPKYWRKHAYKGLILSLFASIVWEPYLVIQLDSNALQRKQCV